MADSPDEDERDWRLAAPDARAEEPAEHVETPARSSSPASAADFGIGHLQKVGLEGMRRSVAAQFRYLDDIARVTSLAEAVAVHTAYARRQYDIAVAHWTEVSRAAQKMMSGAGLTGD